LKRYICHIIKIGVKIFEDNQVKKKMLQKKSLVLHWTWNKMGKKTVYRSVQYEWQNSVSMTILEFGNREASFKVSKKEDDPHITNKRIRHIYFWNVKRQRDGKNNFWMINNETAY